MDNQNIVFSQEPIEAMYSGYKTEYRIVNKSQETYLTWVNFDCKNDNLDVDGQVRNYFKVPRAELSLEGLLFDNVQFLGDFTPILGKTFLRRIEPESTFSYLMDSKQCNSDIVKHIFIVSEAKVSAIIGTMPNINEVLFKGACIDFPIE